MKKDKKKLAHIEVKDNGLIVANKVGDKLADLKTSIINECLKGLIKGSNEKSIVKYKIQQNINLKAFQLEVDKLTAKARKEVKTTLNNDKTVNLTPNQVSDITSVINKGLLFLKKDAVKQYQNTLNDMYLKVKSAEDLKIQLEKHINSGLNLGVVYKDGKNYQFDTYYEMKARTDIQVDIKDNLVESGRDVGVIFYITSYYGDCAKDHADYQGKIYVDDKWEAIAPKERLEEIRAYIEANKVMTIKEVTEAPIFLTTRPNCRHYFMPMDLESVLGVKNDKDLNKLRQENGLNFNGKYKPEKYEALQKQRLNERKIRAEKQEIDKLEHTLALKPNDYKSLQSEIRMRENNVAKYQKDQRELIKEFDNLERQYERESLRSRVTLGATKKT